MKVLHLLKDGQTKLSGSVIAVQSKDNQVKVIDMTKKEASYEAIVDEIFSNDKVICW